MYEGERDTEIGKSVGTQAEEWRREGRGGVGRGGKLTVQCS